MSYRNENQQFDLVWLRLAQIGRDATSERDRENALQNAIATSGEKLRVPDYMSLSYAEAVKRSGDHLPKSPENRPCAKKDATGKHNDNQEVRSNANLADRPSLSDIFAAIQYMGVSGSSKDCKDAVLRLVQYGDRITHARILSCCPHGSVREHSFLLTVNVGDHVAIKSGFASGYGGEGPHTFSYVLQVLESHGAEIDEIDVVPELFERLEYSALTKEDVEKIETSRPRRPSRWPDYVDEKHFEQARQGTLWSSGFPPIVPVAIVDSRIVDLALSFWNGPDEKLMAGYRRLEDIVRQRTGIDQHGSKLFFQAFDERTGRLTWRDGDGGERAGKMILFTAAYQAHRNRRAHRELSEGSEDVLSEFMLLNHLFRLERESVEKEA